MLCYNNDIHVCQILPAAASSFVFSAYLSQGSSELTPKKIHRLTIGFNAQTSGTWLKILWDIVYYCGIFKHFKNTLCTPDSTPQLISRVLDELVSSPSQPMKKPCFLNTACTNSIFSISFPHPDIQPVPKAHLKSPDRQHWDESTAWRKWERTKSKEWQGGCFSFQWSFESWLKQTNVQR